MGKLDQYCFDGTNALSLKKLPTDSKKDQVDKEKILAKTEKNQEKIFALQDKLYADAKEGLIIILHLFFFWFFDSFCLFLILLKHIFHNSLFF